MICNHPDVVSAMPSRPEPKYFLNESCTYNEYMQKFFSQSKRTEKLCLEKSTSYYESREAGKKIFSVLPIVKCLVILRDPIDRALSNYAFSIQNGLETRAINEVFSADPVSIPNRFSTSVNPFNYLSRGCYAKLIEPYLQIFKGNFKVVFLEELSSSLTQEGIFDFLGLELPFKNEFPSINTGNLIEKNESVIDFLKEFYRPHNQELERLLGRNINCWDNKR
jgi:hypothetical protein